MTDPARIQGLELQVQQLSEAQEALQRELESREAAWTESLRMVRRIHAEEREKLGAIAGRLQADLLDEQLRHGRTAQRARQELAALTATHERLREALKTKAKHTREVAYQFVRYYVEGTTGCRNCGGFPHSTECFVGRFVQSLAEDYNERGELESALLSPEGIRQQQNDEKNCTRSPSDGLDSATGSPRSPQTEGDQR